MSIDLLLTSLPPNYLMEPPMAPALLKSAVEYHGFSCHTVDFSITCLKEVFDGNYDRYVRWTSTLMHTFDWQIVDGDSLKNLELAIDAYMTLIDTMQPSVVGLSVFSWWQQRFTFFLCDTIRKKHSHTKILIGGQGASNQPRGLHTVTNLTFFEKRNSFSSFLVKRGLIDHAIINDGEQELVHYLKNRDTYSSTTIHHEIDFDKKLIPNFDDYDLDKYFFNNQDPSLPILGSKGCVRKCVFCSEHSNYSRFYFKQGQDIAHEMIILSQKYGVRKFHMLDSLTNGSLSMFREFISTLSAYNNAHPENKLSWHGNYICRSRNSLRDDDYILLKQSGGHALTIGAESGSNSVLAEMNKRTTVEDLLYEIEKFRQHGIDCTLLFMIGFYNETWHDFLQTLYLLHRLLPYVYSKTLIEVRNGYTLSISDFKQYDLEKFQVDPTITHGYGWIYLPNPQLNLRERVRRIIIAQEFCDQIGLPVTYACEDLSITHQIYSNQSNPETLDAPHN